ncbi:MAG TPA: universal stress protein [Candidatus Deferrimicrobiaceae bacterium]|nr:universal stress protein [Candidatus Deferrimicrobiaceae bacterium]
MRLNEILFPTDFSPASEAAGRVAREMALQTGARLHVLHVVPPVTDPSLPAEHLGQAARSLADGLRVETTLLSGWAGRNIVDYARDKRIDLIVVGTHGRTGITHAILGSVAETVVRLAPCLVLTVPASVIAERSAAPAAPPAAVASPRPCLVCGKAGEDLICEGCRARIRGEALEQKRGAERPGHRGLPV